MAGTWSIHALLVVLALAACEFPRDADGTLHRVQEQGVLRVGYTERPPWVRIENGRPVGIEPGLIEAWAAERGARVDWIAGSETSLVEALRQRRIDILVGGHLDNSPWTEHVAVSQRYIRTSVIVAAPAGTHLPSGKPNLVGRAITHSAARPDFAAHIAAAGAEPRAVRHAEDEWTAVYDFEVRPLSLVSTRTVLATENHIVLAAPGENRLLFELDRFLLRFGSQAILAKGDMP